MKKLIGEYSYRLLIVILVIILGLVSFYMLNVHIPAYNFQHQNDQIRNEICETNNLEYMDYFYQYRGPEVLYILKVKINGIESYVAYNEEKTLVDYTSTPFVDKEVIHQSIYDKYKVTVKDIEVAYENKKFVYYAIYQDEKELSYFYFDCITGDFVKAYQL